MATHEVRTRKTRLPNNGDLGNFTHNGLPRAHGAPYASPGVDDQGNPVGTPRRYKAAVIQTDVVLNKKGWHYPQQRFLTLWGDIGETTSGSRPPQPFFFRSTTGDSVEFWHTNLVPSYYELDDFQVRTPTDVIGQHIHLVKFDVTSSDGAANGFNYEDGTFSPDEVRDRIAAINGVYKDAGLFRMNPRTGFYAGPENPSILTVVPYEQAYPVQYFGSPPPGQNWNGAQTTIQRWDTDPLLNDEGVDRTLRTVFTHDHFGPSTHQQIGLYAGMLVEPAGSKWLLANGTEMNTRFDGGPTSWEAIIVAGSEADRIKDSYREFALEFQDMQLAYDKQSPLNPSSDRFDPTKLADAAAAFDINQNPLFAGNIANYVTDLDASKLPADFPATVFPSFGIPLTPTAQVTVVKPGNLWKITEPAPVNGVAGINAGENYYVSHPSATSLKVFTPGIPPSWVAPKFALNPPSDVNNTANGAPFPTLVSSVGAGTYATGYRNEPIPFRVAPGDNSAEKSNLAYAFQSIARSPELDSQHSGETIIPQDPVTKRKRLYPPQLVTGMEGTDPFTPLLRAFENDKVQIRTLVGAHVQSHLFQVQGVRWLFEPEYGNSGYRNSQMMGLSEHFEMLFRLPPSTPNSKGATDYLYATSSDTVGLNNGNWGIMRAYRGKDAAPKDLQPLPNNPEGRAPATIDYAQAFKDAPTELQRVFNVTAITAAQALKDRPDFPINIQGRLVYNANPAPPKTVTISGGAVLDSNGQVIVRWKPQDQSVNVGDTVTWVVQNAVGHTVPHGVTFLDFTNQAKPFLTITGGQTFKSQKTAFPTAPDPQGTDGDNQQDAVLLTAVINAVPPGGSIPFECTIHKAKMTGTLNVTGAGPDPAAFDPDAILYVRTEDLTPQLTLRQDVQVEPLILRAAAGDWIKVNLTNAVDPNANTFQVKTDQSTIAGVHTTPWAGKSGAENLAAYRTPPQVGLHPHLVSYDAGLANGINVGFNRDQTVPPPQAGKPPETRSFIWYAGILSVAPDGRLVKEPVEFGATNLVPADVQTQHQKGLYGALIIEPEGSSWVEDRVTKSIPNNGLLAQTSLTTRTMATVVKAGGSSFREAVLVFQNDVGNDNLKLVGGPKPTQVLGAVNYRAETMTLRNLNANISGTTAPSPTVLAPSPIGNAQFFSNSLQSNGADPQTPVVFARAGDPVRFRVLYPGGASWQQGKVPYVFNVNGHVWKEEPYINDGRVIGNNRLSNARGMQEFGPYQVFNIVLPSAGGEAKVPGDYLYSTYQGEYAFGTWGILRVTP